MASISGPNSGINVHELFDEIQYKFSDDATKENILFSPFSGSHLGHRYQCCVIRFYKTAWKYSYRQ
jgi:hypothetical protein